MAKKRANGEGSIRKRSDGRWEGRYTAGYDPETGKRITKNVLGKTQAEVKEKLAKAIEESKKLDIGRTNTLWRNGFGCGMSSMPNPISALQPQTVITVGLNHMSFPESEKSS